MNKKSDLTKLVLANLFAHGYMLILTGTFWDDWGSYYHDSASWWRGAWEQGAPWWAALVEMMWKLPDFGYRWLGYRWLAFVVFMLTSILVYIILASINYIGKKDALYLSILYTVLPINDARVVLINSMYIGSLLLFFIAFYLFLRWIKEPSKIRKRFLRIIALFTFGVSFITNSLLVFYGIVLLYLFYIEYHDKKKIAMATIQLFKYVDFIMLPIVYFIGTRIFFPTYGRYLNYNKVTIKSVIIAACKVPSICMKQIALIWYNIFKPIVPSTILLITTCGLIIFAIIKTYQFIWNEKKTTIENFVRKIKEKTKLGNLLLGILLFALGIYAYIVIRGASLAVVGVGSRDTLLLGIGFAFILYYFFEMLLQSVVIKRCVGVLICFFCIISCNLHYMNYQRDAYWQEVLIDKLRVNNQIREVTNILFLSDDASGISGTRYYSLNGDASVAYGDQTRFFMNGYKDLSLLGSEDIKLLVEEYGGGLMRDYDTTYDKLDGIVEFNCDITYVDCLKLKCQEMLNDSKYRKSLRQMGTLSYYPVDSFEAKKLLEGYNYS